VIHYARTKEKEQTMAENKLNEATGNLTQSLRETNQTITESAVAAQERNIAFAQNTFDNGIELLKSHVESTRALMREEVEQSRSQTADFQAVVNSAIAAQERNLHYAQSIVESEAELLKSHLNATRELWQKLAEQSQKQQEAFQSLLHESVDMYVNFLFTPFSYYRQAVDTAESMAWQGIETAQKITRQGFEATQKATRQGQKAAESVTR